MKGTHGRDQPDGLPREGGLVTEGSKGGNGTVDRDRVGTMGRQGGAPGGGHCGFHGYGGKLAA